MPYVNVPNDLSKIKTKLAFNLTKRQLVCFGIAAAVGIPSYLLARSAIGNTGAMQKAKSPKRGPGKAANRKAALSAQQTIPYLVMHPDGVCQLPGGLYTKTVEYEDINYSVASTEDQTAIFGGWSAFLNYFDSSLPFQLSFINRRSRSRWRCMKKTGSPLKRWCGTSCGPVSCGLG